MTAPARDTIALYDAPDGEQLRKLWRGAGQVTARSHDSHVPDGRGGVMPITELQVEVFAEDDEQSLKDLFNAMARAPRHLCPVWIAWGETFVRSHQWTRDYSTRSMRIHCTTGRPCLATTPEGYLVTLHGKTVPIAITEPSPPDLTDAWMPQQRRAASDRLLAAFGHACRPGARSFTPEPATSP